MSAIASSGQLAALEPAFRVAAAELGMCGASWLFVRELAESGGDAQVSALRDELGRGYPVLDAVAAQWLRGGRAPAIDPGDVLAACEGARKLVIVGLEAEFLDALLPRLGGIQAALLTHSALEVDWERVLANYHGLVEGTDLDDFQRHAGPRSVLLTFAYGADSHSLHVPPTWLRVDGDDVRTQFRGLLAWDVLKAPMYVYPRWLVELPTASFSGVL